MPAPRRTSTESEANPQLEIARGLQASLEDAKLNIKDARSTFLENLKSLDDVDDWSGLGLGGDSVEGARRDPAVIAADVAAQMTYLHKLKFQYLERHAKDKFVKTIVSDEPQTVSAMDNELLKKANAGKKEKLKAAKDKLRERQADIKMLAPLVEGDFQKAQGLTTEAVNIATQILNARLELSRLRKAYPHPRITVPAAQQRLTEQEQTMYEQDLELEDKKKKVEQSKIRLAERKKEVERLRAARAEIEKEVRARKLEGAAEEDGRVVGTLYDWYMSTLKLSQSMHSLESYKCPSENELRLTYALPFPSYRDSSHTPSKAKRIMIKLVFIPNTRTLADAKVAGLSEEVVGDLVGIYIQSNDVRGLVAEVLRRARDCATEEAAK